MNPQHPHCSSPITIEYDRGTVVITALTDRMASECADLVRWDERVDAWRAPAHSYAPLHRRLVALGPVVDRVRKPQTLDGQWSDISLRPYQESALLAWRAAKGRGLVCIPTGAGKTRVAIAAMRRTCKATLCLVPTRVLLHQWLDAIKKKFYSGAVGILGDGNHRIEAVTIATFESAFRSAWSMGNRFDLLVIDEVHHFGDGERDEALESCTAPYRLGLTATLDETRLPRLSELVGPRVFENQVSDLLGSALADFDLECIHLALTLQEQMSYETDYNVFRRFFDAFKETEPQGTWEDFVRTSARSESGRAALAGFHRSKRVLALTEGKRAMLCRLLDRHSEQRKLIFTVDSATALTIARILFVATITAEIGKLERDRLVRDFREGKLRTLVSCKVLNEGFDVPDAEVAIIVGGSSAVREHIQRIGRVLRPQAGKRAKIYELLAAGTTEVQSSRRRGRQLEGMRHERHAT